MEQANNTPVAAETVAQVEHLNAHYGDGEGACAGVGVRAGAMFGFRSPAVGHKLYYRPSKWDLTGPGAMIHGGDAPLDATVVAVYGDRCVNLVVHDQSGNQHKRLSVTLLQGADVPVENTAYAWWPQVGIGAKA